MNKNRIKDINNFLKALKQELKTNPNRTNDIIGSNNIYYHLVRYNTKERLNNEDMFEYWVNNNNRYNTNVYVSEEFSYFCQFVSGKEKMQDVSKQHKIYLSLKPSYLKYGVERLFDFLSKENIAHVSKIGKKSRDDQIVIRVNNEDDCAKIIDFINNNDYLREGKKEPNPFAFQDRGVALATDGHCSYNEGISLLISAYLKEMVTTDRIDNINVTTFMEFVSNYYNKYFVNREDIGKVIKDFKIQYGLLNLESIVDYKYIALLFMSGLSDSFDYSRYTDFIKHKEKNYLKETKQFETSKSELIYLNLFNEICNVMIENNGYEEGSWQIKSFVSSGDVNFITRQDQLRYKAGDKAFVEFIREYIKQKDLSIDELIITCIYGNKEDIDRLSSDEIIEKGILETYTYHQQLYEEGKDKYSGFNYAKSAIVKLARDGNYNGFTRNNGTRDQIRQYIAKEDAIYAIEDELGIYDIDQDDIYDLSDVYIKRIVGLERRKRR